MRRGCFVYAFLSALSLGGCWEGMTRNVLATVLSAHGEIVVFTDGASTSQAVNEQSKLRAGCHLRTSNDAKLDLQLIPGALAEISGDSELKIDQLTITKDGNETGDGIRDRVARVSIPHGHIVVLFDGFAHFIIETPQISVAILPDCLIRLDVDQNRTRLTCVRGKVQVAAKNADPVNVDGGNYREWPSEKGAIRVTEDEKAQKDVAAGLQTARELQELAAAQRDKLPVN
jgi:hypothetical protein